MSIEFYIPQQGDTAGTVTDGYATNFETLDASKADAQATAEALAGKVDKADGKDLMTASERAKLTGIEAEANRYVHPASHSADMIDDTAEKVMMTASERDKLSGIETGANAYTHPESHPADMIDDTAEKVMMTASERQKLTGIEAGANAYTLPVATASSLGGVKAGDNVTIADDGTLSATAAPYELPKASSTVLGGVKVGRNLSIDTEGRLSAVGGGSGEGGGILVLPYVTPERDADGNITNSAAFVDAWGGILSAYLAAPDSHALYMDTEADEGLMLRMPCNVMNMGGEADAVQWLISGFTVVNAPISPTDPVPCKATCMANVVCNAAGEMQSLVMYASEGIVGADGQPNLLGADDAVIVALSDNATEEQLKAIMQPVVEALQANPKRRVVIQYGFLLIPTTTAITDTEFLIAALDANPLTVSDPDSKWVVKAQVYCKLSNGVIESATGGMTGYELATTDAMTAALAGKQNTTTDPGAGYDLNKLHTTGTYNIQNAQNAPVPGWIYVNVVKFTGGAGWVSQFVYTLGSDNAPNRIFHRNGMNTSDWSPWVELWHTGNFDPASKMSLKAYIGDLNNIEGSGVYRLFEGAANAPGYSLGCMLAHYEWDSNAARQVCYSYTTSDVNMRCKSGGKWGEWTKLWHSGNFDPATKTTLLPFSLEEQLVPGEFWPGFDGVLRQVYVRTFQGSMATLLADNQLLHNVKEVQYVRGGLGEADLFVPPYPQYFSAGSQWGYLVLGNNLIIDFQDENWNAGMQYSLTFKYTKA